MFWRRPKIEFLCDRENLGAIARPVPANKVLPEWYRAIPQIDSGVFSFNKVGITIKRCAPFMDALGLGWILCVPADVKVEIEGHHIRTSCPMPSKVQMITAHESWQMRGSEWEDKTVLKFETLWSIKTSPGYSVLITQPFNRPHDDFTILTGVIDTDRYFLSIVVPFYFTHGDGIFTIEHGTPLAQVIPFKRQRLKASIRSPTSGEAIEAEQQNRSVFASSGWYRRIARAPR